MMISYSELRRGTALELDGEPYQVIEWKHVKMQQRAPTLTLKVRHMKTGKVFEKRVAGNQKLALAVVDHRQAQYMYSDGSFYYFMDTQTYEQFPLGQEQLGDNIAYLKEGDTISLAFYKGEAISIEVPTFVELKVVNAPSGFKGDTVTAGRKTATLQTGATIKVPLHVSVGDTVKVDTRTGEYVETVS